MPTMKQVILRIKKLLAAAQYLNDLDPNDFIKNWMRTKFLDVIQKEIEKAKTLYEPLINTIQTDGSNQDLSKLNELWYEWEWANEEAKGDLQFLDSLWSGDYLKNAQDTSKTWSNRFASVNDLTEDELKRSWFDVKPF